MHPVIKWLEDKNTFSKEGSQRWYRVDGNGEWVPSVTTVLNVMDKGIYFHKWLANHLNYEHACQVRDEAAQRGTDVHLICETLLEGKEIVLEECSNEILKRIMCFEEWWNSIGVEEIIASEVMLAYPGIQYAGRFDFIARIDGKNTLIDIKTGGYYNTHDLQASMYKILWDTICEELDLGPEYMIEDMYGLYLKDGWIKGPNPQYKKLKFRPKEVEAAITLWRYNNENAYGKVVPPKPKPVYKNTFKLEVKNGKNEKLSELDSKL